MVASTTVKSFRSGRRVSESSVSAGPGRAPRLSVPLTETRVGMRLKHGRLAKGLSLRDVALAIGCSESLISKIENDKARPSLTMLHRLVVALEINIAALFTPSESIEGPVRIMRIGTRPTIRVNAAWDGKNITLEGLMPQAEGALLQANIHHVAPGGSSAGKIQHEGEELGWIIEGALELIVENTVYPLSAGDSFFFSSRLEHGYRNPTERTTRVFWVNSPPSF